MQIMIVNQRFQKKKRRVAMLYIVYYRDDDKVRHMTFVRTYKEVLFIQERFDFITVECCSK